jgi:hypothetical protein
LTGERQRCVEIVESLDAGDHVAALPHQRVARHAFEDGYTEWRLVSDLVRACDPQSRGSVDVDLVDLS